MITNPYAAGRRARGAGYTHLENPYPPGDPNHEAWLRGWAAGADTTTRRET